MNNKMPRSPFATRLSGSAKETRRRIRNLFQGKKKRPPWPVLVLGAAVILLCGSLVSCQTESASHSAAGSLSATRGEPVLSLHMDGVFAQLSGVPAGEASWPEELPGFQFTTGFINQDIVLELEQEPVELNCTEYLIVDGQAVNPLACTVHLYQPSGGENWFAVERRTDSSGEGMETRLYVLTCVWEEGREALEYAFLLTLPSMAADGPVDVPVIVAGAQRVEPDSGCVAFYQDEVIVNAPQREGGWLSVSASVDDGEAVPVIGRTFVGGTGSVTFPLAPLGAEEGRYPAQTQRYTLVFEWDDGTQDTYCFTIHARQLLTIGTAVAEDPINEPAVDKPDMIYMYEATIAGSV